MTPEKKRSIKKIVAFDESSSVTDNISTITSEIASTLVDDYKPSHYLNKNFGDFTAKSIIYSNKKSIILKGTPKNNTYSQEVAIKIHSPMHHYLAGNNHLAMQANYMANVHDNNVVDIKSAGTTEDDIQYLVMEYLPGPNAKEYCIANSLDLHSILNLFLKIAAGVSSLHNKMIIHSDIKPENIIMSVNSEPKLIDFDFSQSHSKSLHEGFNYREIKGYTSNYSPPEQEQDDPQITVQSDIYSLAAVLFELLTGKNHLSQLKNTKEIIVQRHRKFKRVDELAFIIDKALNYEPSKRHTNITELINDMYNVKSGDKISLSYKKHASLRYITQHYVYKNFIILAVLCGIFSFVYFSFTEIVHERDKANESLKLIMKSNDPRELDSNLLVDKEANNGFLNYSQINKEDYYEILMGWGKSYIGKGENEKSIKFFKKAHSLYDKPMENKKIRAVTELIRAYYNLGVILSYTDLITPYLLPVDTNKKIYNPNLIDLYLTLSEIDSRYTNETVLNDNTLSISELLALIDLDNIKDTDLKSRLKIKLLLNKGSSLYYSLPSDDVSVLSYISDKMYREEIKPALLKSLDLFHSALSIIKTENIDTHMESNVNLWLSVIYSELNDENSSAKFYSLALNQTLKIFTKNHPRVALIYLKGFAIYRYINPYEALSYAKLSFDSYKARTLEPHNINLISWVYLINAYLNNGDFKSAAAEFESFKADFEKNKLTNSEEENIFAANFLFYSGLDFLLYTHLNSTFIEKNSHYIQELEEYSGIVDGDSYPEYTQLLKIKRGNSVEYRLALSNYADKIIEGDLFDDDTKTTEMVMIASLCFRTENCNYLRYTKLTEKLMNWSKFDSNMSIEKFTVYVQLIEQYIHSGYIDKASEYLSDIEPILKKQDFENSFFITQFYKLKAQIAFINKEMKEADRFKRKALPGAIYNFGNESKFTKEIMALETNK